MRIGIFEPHPSFQGGSERITLDVSRYLAERGHELFLLHDSAGTMLPTYDGFLRERHQMALRAFGWRTLGASAQRALEVARYWRKCGISAAFSSDIHYLRFLALATFFAKMPLVLHLGIANPLPYRSQRLALKVFAAGITPSEHTAQNWRSEGWPEDRLHVIPNGVDGGRFRPSTNRDAMRDRLGLPRNRVIVLYVGRLVHEKGVGTLLDAFNRVRLAHKEAFLVLVGTNGRVDLSPWPSEARHYGLGENDVHFAGGRTNPEDYLAAANLAIVPTEGKESFGLAAIEAMACGTLPVVSDCGILPQLVECKDLVFPAGQAAHLAERIGWWIANESARDALAKRLFALTTARYRVELMGARYEDLFARLTTRAKSWQNS